MNLRIFIDGPTVTDMLEAAWQTFGPFLIPAAVFAVGAVGYFLLYGLSRLREARQD